MEIHDTHRGTVLKGVEWLDSIRPNWRELVNVNTLQMSSAHFCVLGQVFEAESDDQRPGFRHAVGTYGTYRTCDACDLNMLHADSECGYDKLDWAQQHGFNRHDDMSYEVLYDLWHEVLTGELPEEHDELHHECWCDDE